MRQSSGNGKGDGATGMGSSGLVGSGWATGDGKAAGEAERMDGSKEARTCRAHGVNFTVTWNGSAQARAEGTGGNEAGRDGSVAVSASSSTGYTPCIAALNLFQVFGLASASLVIEKASQDCPSV